jgi:hypothetical protein
VICGSVTHLQVHHKVYRGNLEDALIDDLETLCRKHHRLTHGFGPTDCESKAKEILAMFNREKRPKVSDWQELKVLVQCDDDLIIFGDVMFRYIISFVPGEKHGWASEWWMDKGKYDFWFRRACGVRKSIQERIT